MSLDRFKERQLAKNDPELFKRLRAAGVRKQVAKTLSEIGDDASKKTVRAAHATVAQLRSLADEIERRLPTDTPARARSARPRGTRPAARTRRASRSEPAAPSRSESAASTRANGARTPRGQNRAKILASLKSGPKTASEIAKETGIGTGTVGSTLHKMATAGDVVKADRGYGLPK